MTTRSPDRATPATTPEPDPTSVEKTPDPAKKPREIGGPKGPEPTRYGDWESGGRCIDF